MALRGGYGRLPVCRLRLRQLQILGRVAPWEVLVRVDISAVIASVAKQSIFPRVRSHGLLRRFAPRNDGRESVLGLFEIKRQSRRYCIFFRRAAAAAASTTLSTSSRQLKISAAKIG